MPKEILIYGSIESYSSADFIKQMNDVSADGDLVIRINTPGGSPEYGFGMVAKFKEHQGNKIVKVDGKAFSMGTFFLVYADKVEALDVSEFLIHRAAYPEWFENSELFTEELKGNLDRLNTSLLNALKNKIDVKKFEELKGVKMKDIFSMYSRKNVFLNAKEAKAIGLIDNIVKITPAKAAEINSYNISIAAKYSESSNIEVKPSENSKPTKPIKMNKEELKANHPDLYKEIKEEGVKAERDRAGAWMTYNDVDSKAVAEGIESGEPISQKQMAEFSRKLVSADALAKIEEGSQGAVDTDKPKTETEEEKTAKAKELEDFEAQVKAELAIK